MKKPLPYKGNDPYIFISYAHKDSSKVWPIIVRLQEDGFRVWYDEGIEPGSEWAEDIDRYLSGCAYFFAFMSEAYLKSDNCKDELDRARDLVNNRLIIYLEDIQMEGGIALRNKRLQAIFWYKYSTMDGACAKLYSTRNLEICHVLGKVPDIQAVLEDFEPDAGTMTRPESPQKAAAGQTVPRKETACQAPPQERNAGQTIRRNETARQVSPQERNAGQTIRRKETARQAPQQGENTGQTIRRNETVRQVSQQERDARQTSRQQESAGQAFARSGTQREESPQKPGISGIMKEKRKLLFGAAGVAVAVAAVLFLSFGNERGPFREAEETGEIEAYYKETSEKEEKETGQPDTTEASFAQEAESTVELTSIEQPVEQRGFLIWEDAVNTLGHTYRKAVVLNDFSNAYVRYYVGDYAAVSGYFSIPQNVVGAGESVYLSIYLDDHEDAPLEDYDRLELTNATVEQEFTLDVSGAQFITFYVEGRTKGGLMLTDTVLYTEKPEAGSEPKNSRRESESKGQLELTSIEQPVEQRGFSIWEDAVNTLGHTYRKAVLLNDFSNAYVRYYVGDYAEVSGYFSIPQNVVGAGESVYLSIYLDDHEDAPLEDYDRLELTNATVEQEFTLDVSGAQFITFYVEGKTKGGLMLTDTVLYTEKPETGSEPKSSRRESESKGQLELTSIDQPVEQRGFSIWEDAVNTVGHTYRKAVLLNDFSNAYVRYYVGDYAEVSGYFSIPQNVVGAGESVYLSIYLDDHEDAPLEDYDRLELTNATVEQEFTLDVSGAQFITFYVEGVKGGLMLTDTVLYIEKPEAGSEPKSSRRESESKDQLELTSIEQPVEQRGFSIWEDAVNAVGHTYRKAVVLNDFGNAYVRYYVGDYAAVSGYFSIPQNVVGAGESVYLSIYLDDHEEAPLEDYDRLELTNATVEQEFMLDVSGAQFITFYVEGKTKGGLMLTDTVLYTEKPEAGSEPKSSRRESESKDQLELTSIEQPVEQRGFSIWEDAVNAVGHTYRKAVVLNDFGNAYVRYYVGEYAAVSGYFSIPQNVVGAGESVYLSVYLDDHEEAPLEDYDRLELTNATVEQEFTLDVSGAQFITFYVEGVKGGLMLTDTVLTK